MRCPCEPRMVLDTVAALRARGREGAVTCALIGYHVTSDAKHWSKSTMPPSFTITRPTGRASSESVIRTWDESPQSAFSVELTGEPVLYGIWRAKWAPNEHDFDVTVVSFGWADRHNVGNPNSTTRTRLSAEHAAEARALIIALFEDVEARKKTAPFSSKAARFLGRIEFEEAWVLLRN
jgi:hypothetical protein